MKRLLCGSVVLAASLVLISCTSDPTGDFRGDPARIVADPSSIFLDQGTNLPVNVRLEDDQGNPLATEWDFTAGNGITVDRNEDFLGTTVGAPLESEAQFVVFAGNSPGATSFTVTASGLSLEIPVKITPTSLVATFSNPTPAQNEAVTITAEGYTFLPEAAISFAGTPALLLANDGTSLTFLPSPGATGPAQVDGIAIAFLPTTPLSLVTTTEIAVAPLAPVAGTEDPATAPSLPVPPEGGAAGFFDGPDFAGGAPCIFGTVCRYYKLTVTEEGVYTVTLDWDIGGDIDMYLCPDPGTITGDCDFQAATGNHPEVAEFALTPGTYFVIADDFNRDAAGTQLSILVQHDPPAPAGLRLPRATAPRVRK